MRSRPAASRTLAMGLAFFVTGEAASAQAPAASPAPGAYTGHGLASVDPAALAKYAPPPLPPEVSGRIQGMLDIRAPGLGTLSADGRRLYFGWTVTGVPQVWRLDGPDRFPVQMTGGEDRTSPVAVTPDGKWLVVQRDRKGEENPGLYLQPADGGALVAVQHKPGVQTFPVYVTPDSRWLYYRSNDLSPDSYAIHRYEIASGRRETVFSEKGIWFVADFASDGRLLMARATGSVTSEWSLFDPATKGLTPLFGHGEREEFSAKLGARPGEILVSTPKFGEFRRLYRFRDGRFDPVTAEMKADVSSFSIDEARKRIVYAVNDGGYSRLFALDASTLAPVELPRFEGADHVSAGQMSRDGRYVTLGIETATAPRTSYVYDFETRKATRWVVPSAPEIDTTRFAVATLEHYPARDGTRIPMFVRRPKDPCAGPCPVIVHFHGGPEGQARPGFSPTLQNFVDAGYVVVDPNVRGSDGYGKTWLHADNGPKRLDVITDIEDAARHVKTAFAKDGRPPRIGVYGGSYGGYSVLMAMTLFAGAYDAGVSVVGISNLLSFLNNTAPYRRMLRVSEYGDPEKDRDALVKLSAVTYLDRLKAPLMLIQGANDPRVPAGEAIQMRDWLAARGVEAPLILFPDEGHGSQDRDNRVLEIGHALRFFDRHLKGGPAS